MTKTLLLLVFSAIIMACKTSSGELPAKRPADLNVNYHLDGGMNDYSVDIKIDADSCRYRQRKDGKVIKKSFKLTVAELDSAYLILKKNEFDKIKYITEKGEVYDRGGISITVGWEKKSITVNDSQRSFVKEEFYVQWKTICEELDAMIRKKREFKTSETMLHYLLGGKNRAITGSAIASASAPLPYRIKVCVG